MVALHLFVPHLDLFLDTFDSWTRNDLSRPPNFSKAFSSWDFDKAIDASNDDDNQGFLIHPSLNCSATKGLTTSHMNTSLTLVGSEGEESMSQSRLAWEILK